MSDGRPAEAHPTDDATTVHRLLADKRATVATAESLTGGLLGAALTSIPGASATYRGGVITYATDLKTDFVEVSDEVLARAGAVDPGVATAMAQGVRRTCHATYGVATTGVAGPDPQDGHPVGLVFVAVAGPATSEVVEARFVGNRGEIRAQAVRAALRLLRSTLESVAG